MRTNAKCPECDRRFDLLNEDDADEWANGHDCEAPEPRKVALPIFDGLMRSVFG